MKNIYFVYAIILSLLLIAEIIVFSIKKLKQKKLTEVTLRIRSWWVIFILIILALSTNLALGVGFFAFISFLALKEYLSLIPTRRTDHRVLFWAYLSIPIQYYLIYIGWYGFFIILIPVYFFLLLPFRALLIGETKQFLNSLSTIQWGLMTTVFTIGHLAYLLVLPLPKATGEVSGAGLVLFVILITELNDVAQFCWGKALGKHKIIPKVSPNKTWEGFLGGLVTTIFACQFIAPLLTPLNANHTLIIGALLPCLGFVGDVTISAVKRDIGVKDSGSILPGHGGILDRIDSLTYTAPIFFHFVRYWYS